MKKKAVLLAFVTAVSLASQTRTPARPARTVAEMESLLAKIATYEYGADPEPMIQFNELVADSLGSPELLRTIEARLLRFLQSNATSAGKEIAFRELSLIGTNASIPVLAPMLARAETAEMARYALAAIPGPDADDALRTALPQAANDRIRIGIIGSLGHRKDTKSVPALAALVSSPNVEIAAAAVAALGNIADRPALEALAAARSKTTNPVRDLVSEAYVLCADQFAVRGEKAVAVNVYRQMIAPDEPRMIRTRALHGLTAVEGKNAVPTLIAEMGSGNPGMQVVAIQLLNGVPGADITKEMVAAFPKLSALGQVHLLTALGLREDASARPAILAGIKSSTPEVRAAALAGLGKLGDASSVMVLAEAAAGPGPGRDEARGSLYSLRGSAIDPAIVAAIGSTSGKVKTELIMAAGERPTTGAGDALVKAAAEDADQDVRREALRALRNVGGSAQAPALLDLLLKASTPSDRRDATQTLAAVVRRSQPPPVGAVIAAYKATPELNSRLSLLEVLGQTSSQEALPLLRGAMKDASPEIARAAILALTAWDNAAPLPDLLGLAEGAARIVPADSQESAAGGLGRGATPPTSNLQVLALRGVLKLILLPSQRSVSENGLLLRDAMRLATQTPEKRTILSLLPSFPCRESLEVAQVAVRDPAVADEAKVALAQVKEALRLK